LATAAAEPDILALQVLHLRRLINLKAAVI